ncbi:unnamed protein product [Zymoseptoria tritici ST99CH_3D7]|uniref:Uncharacterized protein n=1 Tax=Zymoseptoria tritici (strain ST99CH_3D7) TaxID=1276538 RepID=A0A1X7RTB5_ZYMT9|nr:unnamed protein product [Zymoseptoria tritici ST99CH_3D7]
MGNPIPDEADFTTNPTRTIQEIAAKLLQSQWTNCNLKAYSLAFEIEKVVRSGCNVDALSHLLGAHHLRFGAHGLKVKALVKWLSGEEEGEGEEAQATQATQATQETPPFVFGTMRCLLEPREQFRLHGLMLRNDSNEARDIRSVLDLSDGIHALAESSR